MGEARKSLEQHRAAEIALRRLHRCIGNTQGRALPLRTRQWGAVDEGYEIADRVGNPTLTARTASSKHFLAGGARRPRETMLHTLAPCCTAVARRRGNAYWDFGVIS